MWVVLPTVSLLCVMLNGCGGAEWLEHGDMQDGAELDRRAQPSPPLPPEASPPLPLEASPPPPSHHHTVCFCSSEYAPVCGSNDITYGNACLANCVRTHYSQISWEPGVCAPPTNERAAGFLGCFKDNPNRAFAGGSVRVGQDLDTFAKCRNRCQESGSKFMALQHGDECYCGNEYETGPDFDQVADYECSLMADKCELQFGCGNAWRNSVWEVGAITTATTATTTYFLSEVGQSCTQACQGGLCDLRAVVLAAQTPEHCHSIIDSMSVPLQLPPLQDGGTSNDDNTGCTYHPLAGQAWSQVLMRDAATTCEVSNVERKRACSCRAEILVRHMGASFIGCHKDNPARRAFDYHPPLRVGQDRQTFARCKRHCDTLDARFMSLQDGDECWCGNTFHSDGDNAMVSSHECGQMWEECGVQFGCGNAWRNSVWDIVTLV